MSQPAYAAGTDAALPPIVIQQQRPKHVLEASAGIDGLYGPDGKLRDPNAPPPVEPPTAPAPGTGGPVPEPAAATPGSNDQLNLPGIEPPPAVDTPPAEDIATLTHKWKSAEGRVLAALRRAEAAEGEAQRLSTEIAMLRAQAPAAPASGPLPDLTPDEIATFGTETIDAINKRATIIAHQMVAPLREQMEALRQAQINIPNTRKAWTRDVMLAELTAEVPNWNQINSDPNFISWLAEEEGLSGVTKQDILTKAYEQNNAEKVIALFKGFGNNGVVPSAMAGTPHHLAAANQPPKVPLEAFAAPGRGSSPGPQQAGSEPTADIWTDAGIRAFYNDVRKGKFAGREAEQKQLEADIILAQATGRYRPN